MELTRGHWWRLLGMVVVVLLLTAFIGAALTAPFDAMGGTPALAAAALVQSAIDMVTAVFLTLVYYDLRARREAATAAVVAPDAWG
jgi:ABC-type glycerol-3-phosphate transport system substrate-binding protein